MQNPNALDSERKAKILDQFEWRAAFGKWARENLVHIR